jgi:hypothetical protein
MTKRAISRAVLVLAAAVIAAASSTPVSAQVYEPLLFAYGELQRYMRGRLNPYVDRKTDFFGGIDAAKATKFAWMGVTYAPLGTLAEDGWRVRLMGGAGRYSYQTSIAPGGINDVSAFSGEVLGGYRKTFENVLGQRLFVGAFAGLHYESQILLYNDPSNPARGSEAGIKGSLEAYARVWERYIGTAFVSGSTVHNKYHGKFSALYELSETWSLRGERWAFGGEFAALGDARYNEERAGLVASLTLEKKIITLSVGALQNSGRGDGSYVTLSVYSPF